MTFYELARWNMIKNIGFFSLNLQFNEPYNISYVIQKNVLIYTNHFVFYVFPKKEKDKKKKTQWFCSKEENQRDCVVYINLNKIAEAWLKKKKKNSVVRKEIKEIV